jgi:hypothetical protein
MSGPASGIKKSRTHPSQASGSGGGPK